ncbi:polymerase [Klamath virus]|uniref:RNA-directed RNA polymerase L n=3 Tax=Klamath virus TaxID=909206 RepID=A0A0D3R1B1_9RHAB|nr:polymerase [Klamath virus]AJR28401.1 polymerase [Klamath virus]
MEPLTIELDDFWSPLDNPDDEDPDWDNARKGRPITVKNLDYNLNSPLLRDELDAFISFSYGRNYPPIFYQKGWEVSRHVVLREGLLPFVSPEKFHPWVGRYLLVEEVPSSLARKILLLTEAHAKITHVIPEIFFKGLNLPAKPFLTRLNIDSVLDLFAKFLDFHFLTLFLNHFGEDLTPLQSLIPFVVETTDEGMIYALETATVGKVWCTQCHILFPSGVLMNRNLVLMVKDTLLARFQTIMTMYPRHDRKFNLEDVMVLQRIYRLGDQMLVKMGNTAYDHLKMLEPICNYRLTQLAREYRPRIPVFPAFGDYIEDTIRELARDNDLMRTFYMNIIGLSKVDLVIQIFGCFRHWGHPYIDYFEGLEKLHEQVTMEKEIDDQLAQSLASDLAYLVLKSQFKKTKKWFVDLGQLTPRHPFYNQIRDNTWPTPKAIEDFGDNWHRLPLVPCFEIPDLTDPSLIYSDKSHSIYRSELIQHIRKNTNQRFPTRRVLNTFLETPARDWKAFLKTIDEEGLPDNALCIGLRPKERELKRVGRFFALMSWELREYFVFTEFLIKEHYIPLFHGLTMADDMTGVIRKLLESSNGQGLDTYESITISNHLDYSKWNNHQRYESNCHVFKVMGQFLGYPNLISRTHEFFKRSLIYFINRPDLMMVRGDTLVNRGAAMVCWNGQAGGLEGLRQKGWSILNLLLILRLGRLRNTEIKVLAQGDNQVLNMHYKLPTHRSDQELDDCIGEVVRNNQYIMMEVDRWATRLGLIINRDETMQSADFLIYGKVPIFRGNVTIPESKRWARVNCVTNDQLPTFANIISTVSSTSLTVSHFSNSFLDAIELYNYLGNLSRLLLETFNPILGSPLAILPEFRAHLGTLGYLVSALYLDPSLGGICGMSLTRFLIRNFPDPVTEGLSFWKLISENTTDISLRRLALKFGNPNLARYKPDDLIKLMEKPESLNIPNSIAAQIVIRSEIREILRRNVKKIKNNIIADAVLYGMQAESHLLRFLGTIKPLFPRFLAEFKAGTYLGLTESLVGLYENSKTIRNRFLGEREHEIDFLIIKSEKSGISHLMSYSQNYHLDLPWACSASRADQLRRESWGDRVIGATIPHPVELLRVPQNVKGLCAQCTAGKKDYLTTFVKIQIEHGVWSRGPYLPYLGSRTSETTSLLTPWEKETIIPLIKRAARLRNSINWFVQPDSNLGRSILNNLQALTGEDPGSFNRGFLRTGSAIHRFSSSRQSAGGFSALSPAILSRFLTTTDTLSDLGSENYDFMFQSLILFAQSSIVDRFPESGSYVVHHHLGCRSCLRTIEEPILDAGIEYRPIDVSRRIRLWIPSQGPILETKVALELSLGDWDKVDPMAKSFHVGRAIGFVFADAVYSGSKLVEESSLFPNSIRMKLHPRPFYEGLLDGLLRGCSIHITHRRNVATLKRPRETLIGSLYYVTGQLSNNAQFINLIRDGPLHNYLLSKSHRTPPSYPLSKWDLGGIFRHVLKEMNLRTGHQGKRDFGTNVWVFADLVGVEIAGPLVLSTSILGLISRISFTTADANKLREFKSLEISLRNKEASPLVLLHTKSVLLCPSEVRHAVKSIVISPDLYPLPKYTFGREAIGKVYGFRLLYELSGEKQTSIEMSVPRMFCPLISGLRVVQLATGAHYKVRSILHRYSISFRDFLCAGDGSGGLTSMCLRLNPDCRGIFNSLLVLDGYDLRGSRPSLPSAVCALGSMARRCVNYESCWEEPSDLTMQSTWDSFQHLRLQHKLKIDLMIFDMENRDDQSRQIETLLSTNTSAILERGGSIIFKTYVHRLLSADTHQWLGSLSRKFEDVYLNQTEFTSTFSSEVYILFHRFCDPVLGIRGIDLESLKTYLQGTMVFKDSDYEFKRALEVAKQDLLSGVPSELLPNPEIELSTGLEIAGVESGRSAVLARFFLDPRIRLEDKYWTIKVLLFDAVVGLSETHKVKPAIPSDNKLLKMISFLIGLEYWWSLCTREQRLFNFWNQCLSSDTQVSFTVSETSKGFVLSAFVGVSRGVVKKRLRLQGLSAPIGAAIRACYRSVGAHHCQPESLNWKYILQFNRGLTLKRVRERSNITDYYRTYSVDRTLKVSSEIVNSSKKTDSSLVD